MTHPTAALLPCGARLHLQHGPIDLVIGADGARDRAFRAASDRFETVLSEIMADWDVVRAPTDAATEPKGLVPRRMHGATQCFARETFVTPMAAVAGSVADEVLAAMVAAAPLSRAYVNNGGDIALHLTPGTRFETAIMGHDGTRIGQVSVRAEDPVRGIATSGCHGRSLSLGVADSVTVLAASAARADAAATLIANAVDLPGHPAIRRRPASDIDEISDLGDRPVTVSRGPLRRDEVSRALEAGFVFAQTCLSAGQIAGAVLHLDGQSVTLGTDAISLSQTRSLAHA